MGFVFVLWEPQGVEGHVSCWDLHQPGHPCRSSFTFSVGSSSGAVRGLWAGSRAPRCVTCMVGIKLRVAEQEGMASNKCLNLI